MDITQLLLGQIPEAIFFALFMIFAKNLKDKRITFIILMIFQYILLKLVFPFSIWFNVIYTFMMFVILKVLYKDKAQITDIFTFTVASLVIVISSPILYFIVWKTLNIFIAYVILHRIFLILFLLFTYKKLPKIQNIYKKIWNRNDNNNKHMKSTTFRALNIVIFNILFSFINFGIIYLLLNLK